MDILFDIYLIGILLSYLFITKSGHFDGYAWRSSEMRGLSLNHVTVLFTLCILLWPSTLAACLIMHFYGKEQK